MANSNESRNRHRLIRAMLHEDQQRDRPSIDWVDGQIRSVALVFSPSVIGRCGAEAFAVGMVFHHGDQRYSRRARRFAALAQRARHPKAGWLVAATFDRSQIMAGLPQRYGTQYRQSSYGWISFPVDGLASDTDRRKLGLTTESPQR
jgi:hypothetical protein